MHYSLLAPLWALISLLIYHAISTLVANRRHAAKAKELGCLPPPALPDCGFLGLRQLKRLQAADAKQLFPDLMLAQQRSMTQTTGRVCSTFTVRVAGQTQVTTSDPRNIKAMLADQFHDL